MKCKKPKENDACCNIMWWHSAYTHNPQAMKKPKLALLSDTNTYKFPGETMGYVVNYSKVRGSRNTTLLEMYEFNTACLQTTYIANTETWKINDLTL